MSWGLAQAGNRAGETGLYLQWWDSDAEQQALAPCSAEAVPLQPFLWPLPWLHELACKVQDFKIFCWLLAAVDNWAVEVQWSSACLPWLCRCVTLSKQVVCKVLSM